MSELRQAIQTAAGQSIVMLYDSVWEGKITADNFSPDFWQKQAGTEVLAKERGITYRVQSEHAQNAWVLRQYYRGGLFGRFVKQSYFFKNEERVRSFAEARLLQRLYSQGLPVPKPIAAMYQRSGLFYRAALLTKYVPNTKTLSQFLNQTDVAAIVPWQRIAEAVYKLNQAGLIHADLNAHNILLQADNTVTVIDLDKSGFYPELDLTSQHREVLARLRRSINKVSTRSLQQQEKDWAAFIYAYRALSA